MQLTKTQIYLILYLSMLAAFAPFSTDIYLASMPIIQNNFHTSTATMQLTLSLFFVSFASALLFWGPLSDRIGRTLIIKIGVSIFIVGSLFCAFSNTILELIIARIIQAIGACSGIVMALAIVKDIFNEKSEISKVLSILVSVSMLAPMIAPIVGSYLLVHIGWRSNFYFLSLYGFILFICAFFLKESHPASTRKALPVNGLLTAYVKQIRNLQFSLSTLAISTNFSVLFSFISSSPFIYINIYKLPPHLFGYFFALNALAITCGSLSVKKLKNKIRDSQIITIGCVAMFFGIIGMFATLHLWQHSIWSIVIPSFVITYGVGVLYPELTSYALKSVISHTGLASSLIGAFRFILAAIVGFIMGSVITQSAMPLAITMLILITLTIFLMILYFNVTEKK